MIEYNKVDKSNYGNYIHYIKKIFSSEKYKSFIGSPKFHGGIYVISVNENVGLLEVIDVNMEDSNLAINICIEDKFRVLSAKVIFDSVGFVFQKYKVHKIMIKVYSNNQNMNRILKKIGVNLDGFILVDSNKDRYINIYSILENEFEMFRNKNWRSIVSNN